MRTIENYTHLVASHCETGSVRNLLRHAGLDISEPMVFGLGSGPAFYYLFFAKGPSTFPLLGIRNKPGSIFTNVATLCGVEVWSGQLPSTDEALARADALIDAGRPVALSVDMFYMRYLPSFLQLHAPFHFIILIGREDGTYAVSDPYYENVGVLRVEDLRAAWETHAPFAKDNFLAHIEKIPSAVDWKEASRKAIVRTSRDMVLPPVIRSIVFFAGVVGIRTYARKIRLWPSRYRGVMLRDGILFNAVSFEAQGTGGGAFRLMYGAFLQEVASLTGSGSIGELATRMIENGRAWREISRRCITLGKKLPMDDAAYEGWHAENRGILEDGVSEIARLVDERADCEERLFRDLEKAARQM